MSKERPLVSQSGYLPRVHMTCLFVEKCVNESPALLARRSCSAVCADSFWCGIVQWARCPRGATGETSKRKAEDEE